MVTAAEQMSNPYYLIGSAYFHVCELSVRKCYFLEKMLFSFPSFFKTREFSESSCLLIQKLDIYLNI